MNFSSLGKYIRYFAAIKFLFEFISKKNKIYFYLCILFTLLLSIAELAFFRRLSAISDLFSSDISIKTPLVLIGFASLVVTLKVLHSRINYKFAAGFGNDLTKMVVNSHYRQDIFQFKYGTKLDLIRMYSHNIEIIIKLLLNINLGLSSLCILIAFFIGLVSKFSFSYSFIALLFTGLLLILPQYVIGPFLRYFNKINIKYYGAAISYLSTIKNNLFGDRIEGLENSQVSEILELDYKFRDSNTSSSFLSGLPRFFIEYIIISGPLLFFIINDKSLGSLEFNSLFSNVVSIGYLVQRAIPCSSSIGQALSTMQGTRLELFEIYNYKKKEVDNYNFNYSRNRIESPVDIEIRSKNLEIFLSKNRIKKITNFNINKPSLISIIGLSGIGKSSLLDVISGLINPSSGTIQLFVNGKIIKNKKEYFNFVSYYIQNQSFEGALSSSQKKLWIKYAKAFGVFDCLDQFLDKSYEERILYPKTFSGGQRQRLSLAKVLSSNKPIFLLDEPTSELDSKNTKLILSQLTKISKKSIVICVTHNKDLISISDQKIEII